MAEKNKKAELTTQQIVTLIILIVSVAVILFLIFRLNPGATSNKEICHNSIILKDKGKGFVSELDCRTNYVCISGGGQCSGKVTETINVNPEDENEVMGAIADKMADCWWMFGEGKINYLNIGEGGLAKTTCALCSEIRFDEILSSKYKISYRKFYDFLLNEDKDGFQRYFQYIYGFSDIDKFQKESLLKTNLDKEFILDEENKKYAIVTGIKKGIKVDVFIGEINIPNLRKSFVPAYYVETGRLSELGCKDFITKT